LTRGHHLSSNNAKTTRLIGRRLFTDGVVRPVYQDDPGRFIVEDGERIDGVWLVPEEDRADTPLIVRNTPSTLDG
jgi:hypothetical protein